MFRIPLKFYIEKSPIVFKSRLTNWILVILKVHPLIFYEFSLKSKISINILAQGYKIICISNVQDFGITKISTEMCASLFTIVIAIL